MGAWPSWMMGAGSLPRRARISSPREPGDWPHGLCAMILSECVWPEANVETVLHSHLLCPVTTPCLPYPNPHPCKSMLLNFLPFLLLLVNNPPTPTPKQYPSTEQIRPHTKMTLKYSKNMLVSMLGYLGSRLYQVPVWYFPNLSPFCPPSLGITPRVVRGHLKGSTWVNPVALCSGHKNMLSLC